MIRIEIRNSISADYAQVHLFLQNHPHPYNSRREDHVLLERVRNHKFILFFSHANGSPELVGVSGIFEHGDEGQWREAGATRIILNGFGLQRIATAVRALHEFILDPEFEAFFATVVDGNTRSASNLRAMGFEDWAPLPALIDAKKALHRRQGAFDRKVDYFIMRMESLPDLAAQTLDWDRPGFVVTREARQEGDATRALLMMQVDVVQRYRDVLEQIARGDLDIY